MTPESKFKRELINIIQREFPGAIILKNDAGYIQGIPDHLILNGPRWAAFEAKAYKNAHIQPNQEHYVNMLNKMSYASFVYPENMEIFLDELQSALKLNWNARLPRSQ